MLYGRCELVWIWRGAWGKGGRDWGAIGGRLVSIRSLEQARGAECERLGKRRWTVLWACIVGR